MTALQSPNQATRANGVATLHLMGSKAESALKKLWNDSDPRQRARALQLLARIPEKQDRYLEQALKDKNPDIRITGLRIALCAQSRRKCCREDARSRPGRGGRYGGMRHRAARLQLTGNAGSVGKTGPTTHRKDRWYLEALGIAADLKADDCFKAWKPPWGIDGTARPVGTSSGASEASTPPPCWLS